MVINIVVKTNKKENSISYDKSTDIYTICTNKPAVDNKANKEIIKIVSKHFGVSPSNVIIKRGLKSKNKVVEIND
ncbi:DUF167 domain-containing protein [bacterium]|nr:DUF167 domain-containing protein [bacterium]